MTQTPRPRSLRRYLVAGVLIWLPILAVVWVIRFLAQLTDQTLLLVPGAYRPEALLGFTPPFLGALLAFLIVLVTGLLVTNLIGRHLVELWEELLQRIPLVRSIYSSVKGLAESVFSQDSAFRKVVIVPYPHPGVWSMGFLTAENLPDISAKTGVPCACVFIPTTPNPTGGFIVIVPRAQVIDLDMNVDAAMKMIVTLGVVAPPSHVIPHA
jgi:uncharacterized membrane protein